MNPDIDLRIASLEKALRDVILPAIPPDQRLARDQVGLLLGHLGVLGAHWKYALRFELEVHDELAALAATLAPQLGDAALRAAIDDQLARDDTLRRDDYDAVSAARRALASLVDRAILDGHATGAIDPHVQQAVLDYAARRAARERCWHQGSGLDPDASALPPLASLFAPPGR